MPKSAQEWNEKFHNELDDTFENLNDFENVDERLNYETVEKMFQDDIEKIKTAVLSIYSQNREVDWKLIKPLKNNLKLLEKKLTIIESARINKQKISQNSINETRKLINEIWNLKTNWWISLSETYKTSAIDELVMNTKGFTDSITHLFSDIDFWITDYSNKSLETTLSEKRIADEIESKQMQESVIDYWDKYIESSIDIFLSLDTRAEKRDFLLDTFSFALENILGPKKFQLVLWKKFSILDWIEEYGWVVYDYIIDYWVSDSIEIVYESYVKDMFS